MASDQKSAPIETEQSNNSGEEESPKESRNILICLASACLPAMQLLDSCYPGLSAVYPIAAGTAVYLEDRYLNNRTETSVKAEQGLGSKRSD